MFDFQGPLHPALFSQGYLKIWTEHNSWKSVHVWKRTTPDNFQLDNSFWKLYQNCILALKYIFLVENNHISEHNDLWLHYSEDYWWLQERRKPIFNPNNYTLKQKYNSDAIFEWKIIWAFSITKRGHWQYWEFLPFLE